MVRPRFRSRPDTPQTHQENTRWYSTGPVRHHPVEHRLRGRSHTHKEIWRADPEVDQAIWQSRICCGVVNRGIALYEGKSSRPSSMEDCGRWTPRPARSYGKCASRPTTWPTQSPWRRASSKAARSSSVSAAASTASVASSPPTMSKTGKLPGASTPCPAILQSLSNIPSWKLPPKPGATNGGRSAAAAPYGTAWPTIATTTSFMSAPASPDHGRHASRPGRQPLCQ